MDPNRKSDRILSEWDAIVHRAQRPARAARPRRSLAGLGAAFGLAGAGVLAAALIVAVLALGGRISSSVGSSPSEPTSSQIAIVSVPPTPSPTPSAVAASPAATATPAPTPKPVESTPPPVVACTDSHLRATIESWEGAAGSRIGNVTVTNTGAAECILREPVGLDLIDGSDHKLMSGPGPAGPEVTLAGGASATTLVETSNYCDPAPTPPVRIVFNLGGGRFLNAPPASPNDATVPPCNGATVPPSIQMQPWSR